jgi:hypothetical protein
MAPVTAGAVRTYLAQLESGTPGASTSREVWDQLVANGAITGEPANAALTDIGRHVLRELSVRASRTDALPLNDVAEQLGRVGADLENVAKSASYFLAELGPVVPIEALPLLRMVAVGLANRRETPGELAEEFRNAWGSTEVMGGDAQDRLLGAELLNAESADMETLYAPMMRTTEAVRGRAGPHEPAVTVAAILHLAAGPGRAPALEAFTALRGQAGGDEAAALLAATGKSPEEAIAARERWRAQLPPLDALDAQLAATYLVAENTSRADVAARLAALAPLLASRYSRPGVAAALLATSASIEPAELMDWLDKAAAVVRARKIAPTDRELDALALAIVHGLPASEFVRSGGPVPVVEETSAPLVALHAWLYRPIVVAEQPRVAPAR